MFSCIICRFAVPLDDVELRRGDAGLCVCVRCYATETDSYAPMPKDLRRDVSALVDTLSTAGSV